MDSMPLINIVHVWFLEYGVVLDDSFFSRLTVPSCGDLGRTKPGEVIRDTAHC